jgi:hypothetical protein
MNWLLILPCLAIVLALMLIKCRPATSIPCAVCGLFVFAAVILLVSGSRHHEASGHFAVAPREWEEPVPPNTSGKRASGNTQNVLEVAATDASGPEAITVGELIGSVGKPDVPRLDLTAIGVGVDAHIKRPVVEWDALITKRLLDHNGKEGRFTITLVWFTDADLDLWLVFDNGSRIGYSHRRDHGGELDVDANVAEVIPDPVENITFLHNLPPGRFRICVDHYPHPQDDPPRKDSRGPTNFVLRVLVNGRRTLYFGKVDHVSADPATPEYTLPITFSF